MQHIVSSVKNNEKRLSKIGNKAKVLIELKAYGFNVPDFFVISSDVSDVLFFENEIFNQYEKLNSELVAVRSSAEGEDGLKKSFAGQYKTILNVSKEDLLIAIRECVDSLDAPHILVYSQNKRIESMAIIVQSMVVAEISGVAFSADPVRNDTSVIIIESVQGPCELLVSGKVNPEHYIIHKDLQMDSKVPDSIKQVAKTTKEIEEKLGYFVDIEWVFSGGELYILQARPITTLH